MNRYPLVIETVPTFCGPGDRKLAKLRDDVGLKMHQEVQNVAWRRGGRFKDQRVPINDDLDASHPCGDESLNRAPIDR